MTATIGPDDGDIHESPRPRILRAITGLEPVAKETHVLLEELGFRSIQRLAAGDVDGTLVVALWPAELKPQALYLYGQRLARPMISAALAHGWTATPSPHLAFWNAAPAVRLYMQATVDALEYARRWEEEDLDWVGARSRADVRRTLWPWLKSRGYVTDGDDATLEQWLASYLGRRRAAFLRPGLRLKRRCSPDDKPPALRREVDAIFEAAGEPPLPRR
jgi:hypothetical protein